jgi:hypothetical protein
MLESEGGRYKKKRTVFVSESSLAFSAYILIISKQKVENICVLTDKALQNSISQAFEENVQWAFHLRVGGRYIASSQSQLAMCQVTGH